MSHLELAQKANLSTGALSSITRGQGNPTLETMESIANALQTPLPFLLSHHDLGDAVKILNQSEEDKISMHDYECITVILPKFKAFQVKAWGEDTIKHLHSLYTKKK